MIYILWRIFAYSDFNTSNALIGEQICKLAFSRFQLSTVDSMFGSNKCCICRLTCADTAGVLGNLCNHAAFLRASVAYVRLDADPTTLIIMSVALQYFLFLCASH